MKTIKTLEEAFEAVRKNGRYLQYVPKDLRTQELCMMAVKDNGLALQYVPKALKTSGLCKLSVENCGGALEFFPEALKTSDLCKLAAKNHGLALRFVPNQKSFLTTYPEFLPIYFEITLKKDQDPDIISLLILTASNNVIDEIEGLINLALIQEKDLPFLVGCQNKAITDFLNKKFKTKGT